MAYTANIIPTMTSNTVPSGVASASTVYSSAYWAWRAFDHKNRANGPDAWLASAATGWLQYQFPVSHVITCYAVTSANNSPPRPPKTWTFKGSTDGGTWVTLDTQTNVTDWASSLDVRKVFTITNLTAYAYYRLDVTVGNDALLSVGEMEMMETSRFPVVGSPIVQGMRV